MASQKIIRCEIRPSGSAERVTERYVPLEIFGLWEHLMTAKHGIEVVNSLASLWLDMEDSPEAAYSDGQYERVTEVTAFVYSGRDEMFTRSCRYFPSDECPRLKDIFLSHYQGEDVARLQPPVRERPGIWLHRSLAIEPTV